MMKPAIPVASCLAALAAVIYPLAGPSRAPQALFAQSRATPQAPAFEVDPFWPKPLPNHWVTGSTIGVSVDSQDNVWTIHRPNSV